jgi:synaptobrevin family protein YKT6
VCIKLEETDQALTYAVLTSDGLGGVIFADKEYPGKVAIKIIHEMIDLFKKSVNPMTYSAAQKDLEISFPPIETMIKKYQDPKEADKLLKLENELGQVQQMLTKTMTDVSFADFSWLSEGPS